MTDLLDTVHGGIGRPGHTPGPRRVLSTELRVRPACRVGEHAGCLLDGDGLADGEEVADSDGDTPERPEALSVPRYLCSGSMNTRRWRRGDKEYLDGSAVLM